METENSAFAKQYTSLQKDVKNNGTIISGNETISSMPFHASFESLSSNQRKYQIIRSYPMMEQMPYNNDEPIDLTKQAKLENNLPNSNNNLVEAETFNIQPENEMVIAPSDNYFPKKRRKRRKFAYTEDGRLVLIPGSGGSMQTANSFTEEKQIEILKAAKSLFSKRTRTLYHWMYPNIPKQQMLTAINDSWNSLGASEKEFYVSQVLGRFGFAQTSVMVNPQVGCIKELPEISYASESKPKPNELQTAICSILPDNPMPSEGHLSFEEFERLNEKNKKRRGRPRGSSGQRPKHKLAGGSLAQDFQDDPELSKELEQFAVMFNLNKI